MTDPVTRGRAEDSREAFLAKRLDPLVAAGRTRVAPLLLGLGMLVSLVYVLAITRGTTFSNDELIWVINAPNFGWGNAFDPQNGHLLLIGRFVYKVLVEAVGVDYLTFRLLTLVAVFLATALLFAYARRRVGDYLALAPCAVMLFFGSDWMHLLQGNGFTIMFAISCGMLALLAIERESTAGNLVACLALCAGVATYSVALGFLAGAIVAVLLGRGALGRIWVVAVPTGLYLAWQVWIRVEGLNAGNAGAHFENFALLPAWTFQSFVGILNALAGLNYNFESGRYLEVGEMAGPALAVIFVIWVGRRIARGGLTLWFAAAVAATLALFLTQVLIWEPAGREPASSRYLFPGAFVLLLVLIESVRGQRFLSTRTGFISIWLIALCGLAGNAMIARDYGAALRERTEQVKADVSAVSLLTEAAPFIGDQPVEEVAAPFLTEPSLGYIAPAAAEHPELGFEPGRLGEASPGARARIDSVMAETLGLALVPDPSAPRASCSPAGDKRELPAGGAVLFSETGGKLSLRRFGDGFAVPGGELAPDQPARLKIPADGDPTAWKVSPDISDLEICPLPPGD